MNPAATPAADTLEDVESKLFTAHDFPLESGAVLPELTLALKQAGVDARYFEIDTELGHLAGGLDGDKWAPALRTFLDELASAG